MPDLYERNLPPPDVAIELPPEELALFVLRFLNDPDTSGQYRNRYTFVYSSFVASPYSRTDKREQLAQALAEAWAWLEREGLIVPSPTSQGEWFVVSRRGRTLTAAADFEAYKRGNLLRRDSLDPVLEEKAWALFIRGDYDVAVFQAFKLVEVRVRTLGSFSEADYGVDMMQRAFRPGGPLADPSQQPAEQEAIRSLFAGAIGVFKNPGSHRDVRVEAPEAVEAIYLANTLLRVLGHAEARLAASRRGSDGPRIGT
jgi:uncharacterized protein (TIGR02391 family)